MLHRHQKLLAAPHASVPSSLGKGTHAGAATPLQSSLLLASRENREVSQEGELGSYRTPDRHRPPSEASACAWTPQTEAHGAVPHMSMVLSFRKSLCSGLSTSTTPHGYRRPLTFLPLASIS